MSSPCCKARLSLVAAAARLSLLLSLSLFICLISILQFSFHYLLHPLHLCSNHLSLFCQTSFNNIVETAVHKIKVLLKGENNTMHLLQRGSDLRPLSYWFPLNLPTTLTPKLQSHLKHVGNTDNTLNTNTSSCS